MSSTDRVRVVLHSERGILLRCGDSGRGQPGRATERSGRLRGPSRREPGAPATLSSVEELYLTGQHLEQYRHATRSPEPYWQEALSRDPGHSADPHRLGGPALPHGPLRRGRAHLRAAIERLTVAQPQSAGRRGALPARPDPGPAGPRDEAYGLSPKRPGSMPGSRAGNHQMALIDAHGAPRRTGTRPRRGRAAGTPDHAQVRNLRVVLLRRLGPQRPGRTLLAETLSADPLDVWALYLAGSLDPRPATPRP